MLPRRTPNPRRQPCPKPCVTAAVPVEKKFAELLPELADAIHAYFNCDPMVQEERWGEIIIESRDVRRNYNLSAVAKELFELEPESNVEKCVEYLLRDVENSYLTLGK